MKIFNKNTLTDATGFTLVEVLIYSALLASLFGTTFVVVNDILTMNDRFLQRNELSANHEFVERKFEWIFMHAESVEFPEKNASSSSGLTVRTHSTSTNPAAWNLHEENLYFSLAGSSSSTLTNNRVNVSEFSIEHISNEQAESSVHITVTLETAGTAHATSTAKYFFVVE